MRKASLPVGGWKKGALLTIQQGDGEEEWRRKNAILVEMTCDFVTVSFDNLDSWVLDSLVKHNQVMEELIVFKRSDEEIYSRNIKDLKYLLGKTPNFSSSSPQGFIFRAMFGEQEEITPDHLYQPTETPELKIFNNDIRSDLSKMAALERAATRPPVLVLHGPPGTGRDHPASTHALALQVRPRPWPRLCCTP